MMFKFNIQKTDLTHLKPFVSICIIISTLLGIVFLKMEERRLGYLILKLTRNQNALVEEKRKKMILHAKLIKPQHVEATSRKTPINEKIGVLSNHTFDWS